MTGRQARIVSAVVAWSIVGLGLIGILHTLGVLFAPVA